MEILECIVRSFTSMSIIYFFAALAEKGNSIPLKGNQLQVSFGKKEKRKTWLWSWKKKCGICGLEVMMRPDTNLKARIAYFERRN